MIRTKLLVASAISLNVELGTDMKGNKLDSMSVNYSKVQAMRLENKNTCILAIGC
jgi:hypothetical protein